MHTFVVRVFVASDLDGFVGIVEEPLTGLRRSFDGPDDLVSCLVLASRQRGAPRADAVLDRSAVDPTDRGGDDGRP